MSHRDITSASSGKVVVCGLLPSNRANPHFPISYVHSVQAAGGRPVVVSAHGLGPNDAAHEDVEMHLDLDPGTDLPPGTVGLVLTGGGDINPARYGQEPHPRTYNVNDRRDAFELHLLEQALARDLPILAICRGMQLLNIHLGGNLDQNLADVPGRLEHDRDRPRAEPAHGAKVEAASPLGEIFGAHADVNSHHHQGLDRVAPPLTEVAWADDGVLEGVVAEDYPWLIGVQWHPEAMAATDHLERALFEEFVAATRTYAPAQAAQEARTA